MSASAPRVLVESDPALPLIHIAVSATSGARTDPEELAGVSRLALRLARRTPGGRSTDAVDEELEALGGSVGVECGHDSVSLSGSVLARNFDAYWELVSQMILAPGLCEKELRRLQRETLAERLEVLDNDQQLAHRWFSRTLYRGHPYGRSVVGSPASLEKISVQNARAAIERHFLCGQTVFSCAGDIGESTARRAVEVLKGGSAIDWRQSEAPASFRQKPGRHLVFVDKPERTQTQILIGGLGSHPRDEDHMDLLVANTAFGGTFTSRLSQEVRAKRGWSYGAYSSLGYERQRRAFSMWTFPGAENAAECVQLELSLLDQFWRQGVEEEELARAKSYLTKSFAFARDTAAKRLGLKLDEIASGLLEGHYEHYLEGVERVTVASAKEAIQKRLSLSDLTMVVVGTHADIGEQIVGVVDNLESSTVVPYDSD